jgi:uncharacterized membrane protein
MTRALGALAVAGLAVSGYLTWVHYAELESFCSSISDCERVQSSDYAELAGIPVALLGVAATSPSWPRCGCVPRSRPCSRTSAWVSAAT